MWEERGADFGNGRTMRNLFQKVYENLSLRIAVLDQASEEQCFTIHQADIPGIGQDVVTSPTPYSFSKARRLLSMSDIPFTPSAIIEDNEKGAGAMGNLRLVLPAVGFVEVTEANGDFGTGSGFVITPDGKFLTCYHVTENAQSLRVRFDNDPHKYYEAVYLDGDSDADIALLQLSSGSFDHALLISSGEEVQLGDEVGLLGYPLGTDLGMQVTYTKGVISSFRKTEDDAMLYQIDANAYPGSSGGPLFRQSDGRVVGILKGGFKEERAPGINFAVSVQELFRRLVKEEKNALPVEAATTFDN
jgi:S1-C subfamily serine protease